MINYIISDLSSIDSVATQFLDDWKHQKVFAFQGILGAGKTTFITALLKKMGVVDLQGSPTYSIMHSYDSPTHGIVHHLDCYRIETQREAYEIGLEELFDSSDYCFIEWAQNITNFLPPNTVHVQITRQKDTQARIISAKKRVSPYIN